MIFRAVQAMKESKLQRVEMAWQHARAGYEYTHFMMNVGDQMEKTGSSLPTNTGRNPADLDEKLLLKKKHVLVPFSNTMVHCKTPVNTDAGVQATRDDPCSVPGGQVQFTQRHLCTKNLHGVEGWEPERVRGPQESYR